MEERKTILGYIEQVFLTFGFTIFTVGIICMIVGEDAKEFSTMFQLGRTGLAMETILQYFSLSFIIVILRIIFSTDILIKKLSSLIRTICLLASVIITMVIFIYICDWFPINMWEPWVMFFLCFGICFVVSTFIFTQTEKMENRKLEEALQRLHQEDNNEIHD